MSQRLIKQRAADRFVPEAFEAAPYIEHGHQLSWLQGSLCAPLPGLVPGRQSSQILQIATRISKRSRTLLAAMSTLAPYRPNSLASYKQVVRTKTDDRSRHKPPLHANR